MINKAGREIPEEILKATGKKPFEGAYAYDNYEYKKAAPTVRALSDPKRSKMVDSIREALEKCGLRDNMTLSFHHHFREGDYVLNMVMEEVHRMGVKGITICASSMGKANDAIVPYIEDGTVTGIQSSGVRGKIGQAISSGKLRDLAIMRSHGGRVRAIESGEVHIDIAFIGAPTCDEYGNCRPNGGKSDCGVLSYAMVDAQYADKVVAVTDCLVPFPNIPASISMTNVDYVCGVDAIGNPAKIATGAAKPTTDVRKLMMADYCTQFVIHTPYFRDGFSYQTGVGGASIASTISSTVTSSSPAISASVGSRPFSRSSRSRTAYAFHASSRIGRLTFTIPSDRRNRRISPPIIGTAYVEKQTSNEGSNLSIAFNSPMLPIWHRSSISTPRFANRLTMLQTSPIFSSASVSLAALSPSCTCLISARVRSICQPAATPFCRFLLF